MAEVITTSSSSPSSSRLTSINYNPIIRIGCIGLGAIGGFISSVCINAHKNMLQKPNNLNKIEITFHSRQLNYS